MNTKDYRAIASIIRIAKQVKRQKFEVMCVELVRYMKLDNPKFNLEKFSKATRP